MYDKWSNLATSDSDEENENAGSRNRAKLKQWNDAESRKSQADLAFHALLARDNHDAAEEKRLYQDTVSQYEGALHMLRQLSIEQCPGHKEKEELTLACHLNASAASNPLLPISQSRQFGAMTPFIRRMHSRTR